VILESVVTCPHCGHKAAETMPTDVCRFFYHCKGCGERLKPKAGDCCVFCYPVSPACGIGALTPESLARVFWH
jgi:hypothetical protein